MSRRARRYAEATAAKRGDFMAQDLSPGLTAWLAAQPDARLHVREAAEAIANGQPLGDADEDQGSAMNEEGLSPSAWLVTWKGGEHSYVQAFASELTAVDKARIVGGSCIPLYDLTAAPVAIMDMRIALGLCAPTEADFPALYALQGKRVALVDLGPYSGDSKREGA